MILLSCAAFLYSADLKAPDAQWVAELGGTTIRNSQGRVTGVSLRGSWVEDADLHKLAELPDLNFLDLSLTHITDQGLQELKPLPGITDLNLYYTEYVTDQGLSALKDWKKLKRLNVHGTKISDTGLEHISGIKSLEALNVGSTLMTDVGLERLTMLPNLKELTMGGNELGDAGLQALRQMPGLTYLDLSGRQGTDKNVWTVALSENGMQAVATLKDLRELRLGCYTIGVGYEGTRLGEVSVPNVTTHWLEQMKSLPKLAKLKLQGCKRIDDDSVKTMIALPALLGVDLQGTAVTEKGAAAFRAAKPGATVLFGPWDGKSANYRNN